MTDMLRIRRLGTVDYEPTWQAMQAFTETRTDDTPDEVWFLEHPPVFTLGRNTRREHLHDTGAIPVVQSDRGGQVTYHGPGQLVIYTLLDIRRRNLGVQSLVRLLEQLVIDYCAANDITAQRRDKAPGVYVDGRKLAALGLRVRRGCSYHGLSLNVDMDLSPFGMIDPCGYEGMEVTQLRELGVASGAESIQQQLQERLENSLATLAT